VLDLLLAISLVVIRGAFVEVVLAVLEHSIDESGESVSHGSDSFGTPSFVRNRQYCAPRYVWLFSRVEVPSRSAVAARLIPSHQFIHLRLFAFSECPSTAGMRINVSSLAF